MIQPSAKTSSLLKGVALALKVVEKPIRADISKETRGTMNPVWRDAVAARARSRMDAAVFGKGARIAAGNPARAVAASSRRSLSGGFTPDRDGRALEFGADRNATTTYRRTTRHGTHDVTRHTRRGLPPRNRKGRVVFPAFAEVAPRMVSMWVQIVVRNIHESLEER
jgi:hypothetical protein